MRRRYVENRDDLPFIVEPCFTNETGAYPNTYAIGVDGNTTDLYVMHNSALHRVTPGASTSAWPYDPNPPVSPDWYLQAIEGDGTYVYVQRNPGSTPRIFKLTNGYRSPLEVD